jgi:hypothetical protein
MSTPSPILKRPKLEQRNNDDDNEASLNQKSNENSGREEEEDSIEEQKVAFIALIEHRSHEVQHLKQRLSYYKTQVPSSSSSSLIFKSLHFLFFSIKYCLFLVFFLLL